MALARDLATAAGRARGVDNVATDRIIYQSDFDRGFDGWIDHWDGYRPQPVVSFTEEMQYTGKRSMMLSTSEDANPVAGDPSNSLAVFKRLARHDEYRYHSLSASLALGVGGYSATWSTFQMFFDTQSFDSTVRSFFKVQCVLAAPPAMNRWQIRGNSGDSNFINVPNSNRVFVGNNDNKHNFEYVRMTVDLQANSGLGGYHRLQIGRGAAATIFDLTVLGAGSSLETPQYDGSNHITDFSGGHNIGFGLARNTAAVGGCQLFVDDVVYSVSNTA